MRCIMEFLGDLPQMPPHRIHMDDSAQYVPFEAFKCSDVAHSTSQLQEFIERGKEFLRRYIFRNIRFPKISKYLTVALYQGI